MKEFGLRKDALLKRIVASAPSHWNWVHGKHPVGDTYIARLNKVRKALKKEEQRNAQKLENGVADTSGLPALLTAIEVRLGRIEASRDLTPEIAVDYLAAEAKRSGEVRLLTGRLLSALRGDADSFSGLAFEALQLILEHVDDGENRKLIEQLVDVGSKYDHKSQGEIIRRGT